jgi:hypothetical protein
MRGLLRGCQTGRSCPLWVHKPFCVPVLSGRRPRSNSASATCVLTVSFSLGQSRWRRGHVVHNHGLPPGKLAAGTASPFVARNWPSAHALALQRMKPAATRDRLADLLIGIVIAGPRASLRIVLPGADDAALCAANLTDLAGRARDIATRTRVAEAATSGPRKLPPLSSE